jgi:DNA-3-methyladenine glycosylase II
MIIRSEHNLQQGAAELIVVEPRFRVPFDAVQGAIPLRLKPPGFATLLSAIVSQQVSTASAAAIWARVEGAGLISPKAVAAASEDDLRAVGLSRPKMRYARALAESGLDFERLGAAGDDEVLISLTALPGIGVWTAEIYLLFSLGRSDILPAGDLALQIAAADLFGLGDRLSERQLRTLGQGWSPWRGVAARLLWVWYRARHNREGIGL